MFQTILYSVVPGDFKSRVEVHATLNMHTETLYFCIMLFIVLSKYQLPPKCEIRMLPREYKRVKSCENLSGSDHVNLIYINTNYIL